MSASYKKQKDAASIPNAGVFASAYSQIKSKQIFAILTH
jgi:hypothetical protein